MGEPGTGRLYGLLDVGGTKVATAIARDASILGTRRISTDTAEGPDAATSRIAGAIRELQAELGLDGEGLAAIGASIPGPNDLVNGIVLAAHNVGWFDYPFVARFAAEFNGIPVVLDDDANCAGIGEARFGSGVGFRHQVFVTVSTGIGGAVIIDGSVYRGWQGVAGEVGHVCVIPDGPLCPCGNVGCAEAVASGPAIVRRGRSMFVQHQAPVLEEFADGDPANVTTKLVFDAARAGDPGCVAVVEDAGRFLGILAADLVQVLNPQAIVWGGGVMLNQADVLLPRVRAEIDRRVFAVHREGLVLATGMHGDLAGLHGALALAMEAAGDV